MKNTEKTMDKIVALCKNRGFVFPGSEIYGGLANTWDYGPLGAELKKNISFRICRNCRSNADQRQSFTQQIYQQGHQGPACQCQRGW